MMSCASVLMILDDHHDRWATLALGSKTVTHNSFWLLLGRIEVPVSEILQLAPDTEGGLGWLVALQTVVAFLPT